MRVGCIGGNQDKEAKSLGSDICISNSFPYVLQHAKGNSYSRESGYEDYNLMLFKKNGEFKFFYVYEKIESSVKELASQEEYWELSDVLGYDLD